jgi:hypothetical protein
MSSKEEIDAMNLQIPPSRFCYKEKLSVLNVESFLTIDILTIDNQISEVNPDEFRSIELIDVGDVDLTAPKQARWYINRTQWYMLLFTYFVSDP